MTDHRLRKYQRKKDRAFRLGQHGKIDRLLRLYWRYWHKHYQHRSLWET